MAKIIDLPRFNSSRVEFTSPGVYVDGTDIASNLNSGIHINGSSNILQFENKNGDNIVITPLELKEHITDFIVNEVDLYVDDTVKQYREQLQRRFDVQISNLEGHINDKINKITEDIISTTTSRLINEEVNRRVDEKLRKIRKAIDDSI
jgi:hypothetical protein